MPIFFTSGPKGGGRGRRDGGGSNDAAPPETPLTVTLQTIRTDGASDSGVVTAVSFPLYDSALHDLTHLRITKGGVEQAILTPVAVGKYASGRPRFVYTEVACGDTSTRPDLIVDFGSGARGTTDRSSRTYTDWEVNDITVDGFVTKLLPLNMRTDWRQIGHAPSVALPKGSAGSDWINNSRALLLVGRRAVLQADAAIGSTITLHFTRLDQYLGYVSGYHWNGGSNTPTTLVRTNNTNFGGQDLTDPLTGGEGLTYESGFTERPPRFYAWRGTAGVTSFSGGQNYYGADRICFEAFIANDCDAEWWFMGCAYAEANRHAMRWQLNVINSTLHTYGVTPYAAQTGSYQPEGWAMAALWTAAPAMISALQQQASREFGNIVAAGVGDVNNFNGEGRPIERIGDVGLGAWMVTTAAQETTNWAAAIDAYVDVVLGGTALSWWNGTPQQGTWTCIPSANCNKGDPVLAGGVNHFMQAMVCTILSKMYDMAPINSTRKAGILAAITANAEWRYPTGAPTTPWGPQYIGNWAGTPTFLCGFDGNCDPFLYPPTPDIANIHTQNYFWLARVTGNGKYTRLARRVFVYAVGLGPTDGYYGPFLNGLKQSREQFCSSLIGISEILRGLPAESAIASDVCTQVTSDAPTTQSLAIGGSVAYHGVPRMLNGLPTSDTVTWTTTDGSVASVGPALVADEEDEDRKWAAFWQNLFERERERRRLNNEPDTPFPPPPERATRGVNDVTVTGVSAGAASVRCSAIAGTILSPSTAVVVTSAQFHDGFTGSSLDASKQDNQSTGNGTANVSGGQVAVAGGGTASGQGVILSKPAFSLDAAGANGAVIKIVSAVGVGGGYYVAIVDATGAGVGMLILSNATLVNNGTFSAFTYSQVSGSSGFAAPKQYRFTKSGSNIVIEQRNTDSDSWALYATFSASGITTTAMKFWLLASGDTSGLNTLTVDDEAVF